MRIFLWMLLCALSVVLSSSRPAHAWRWGRWRLNLKLNFDSGYDDNVRRISIPPQPEQLFPWEGVKDQREHSSPLPPVAIHGDGVHQLGLQLRLKLRTSRHIWIALYRAGFKHFFLTTDEDAFSQQIQSTYYFRAARRLLVGVQASGADLRRVNQSREFSDMRGHVFLLWLAPLQFQVQFQVGYGMFLYRHFEGKEFEDFYTDGFSDGKRYSSHGDAYGLTVRKRFGRALRFRATYQFSRQFFQVLRPRDAQGVCQASKEVPRDDSHHNASVGVRMLYFVLFDASYQFEVHNAASCGESYIGHRLMLRLAARPFWKLFVSAQLQLQFRTFLDGTPFDPALSFTQDDNLTSFTLRISRPLLPHLQINLRFSHFANLLGLGINQYSRNLFTVGISLQF